MQRFLAPNSTIAIWSFFSMSKLYIVLQAYINRKLLRMLPKAQRSSKSESRNQNYNKFEDFDESIYPTFDSYFQT